MFEEFSKQKEMKVHHLERAKIKIRELMALTKHTAKRSKGMGHNTVNYHAFIHLPQIYLDLAAAMYLNTQDNEHHHTRRKELRTEPTNTPKILTLATAGKPLK